jgi:hypothetical protein
MALKAKSGDPTRARELTKAARQGQAAIRTALKELTPQSRERVKARGLTTSRVRLKTVADVIAKATKPSITFSVDKSGRLEAPSVSGIARHEVAHFSLPTSKPSVPFSGQHFTLQAAGARGEFLSVPSGAVLRRAEGAARQPSSRRVTQSLKFLGARLRKK